MAKNNAFKPSQFPKDATPEAETPYARARQEWDDRIGSARVQAKNWRTMALLALLASILLIILLGVTLSQNKTTVFVAEVTKSGQVVNVSALKQAYSPNQAQKEYFIAQFIKNSRSLPLDPVVAKQNWLNAYAYLSEGAAAELTADMKKAKPEEQLGKVATTVTISDINALSPNSFQVDWHEDTVDINGKPISSTNYSGVFSTTVIAPKNTQAILKNPLGIFITQFSISERNS